MAVKQDNVQVNLEVNGSKALTELDNLERHADQLAKQLKEVKKGTVEYVEANKKLNEVNKKIEENRKELGLTGMSFSQLTRQSGQLIKEIKGLTPGTEQFIDKTKQLQGVKQRMAEVEKGIKGVDNAMDKAATQTGGFAGKLKGAASSAAGALAGMFVVDKALELGQAIYETTKEVVELRKEASKLTGATGAELDEIAVGVKGLADTYKKDYQEVLLTANALAENMKISTSEALAEMEKGFLAGADASGEFLEQVREYAPHFHDAKLGADELMAVISQSTTGGIFSDKGVDVIKEFGLKIREQASSTQDALIGAFGPDFTKELFDGLNNGTVTTADALKRVSKALAETKLTAAQAQAVVADVFGGPGEDAGLEYLKSLHNIKTTTEELIDVNSAYIQQQKEVTQSYKDLAKEQNELAKNMEKLPGRLEIWMNRIKEFGFLLANSWVNIFKSAEENRKERVDSMVYDFMTEFEKKSAEERDRLAKTTQEYLKAKQEILAAGREFDADSGTYTGEKLTEDRRKELEEELLYYQGRWQAIVDFYTKKYQADQKALQDSKGIAAEALKAQQDAAKKLAEQRAKDELEASRRIADLQVALIEDETTRKIEAQKLAASREREEVQASLANARLKETELILLEKKLQADILQVQKEAFEKQEALRKQQEEKEKKAREERARLEMELAQEAALARADLEVIQAGKNETKLLDATLKRLDTQHQVSLEQLQQQRDEEIEAANQDQALIQQIQLSYQDQELLMVAQLEAEKDRIREEFALKEQARQQQMIDSMVSLLQGGLQAISDFNTLQTDKQINEAETLKNSRLAKLKGELNEKKLSEEDYQSAVAATQDQYDKQARRIKREAAKADKQAKSLEAIMATALAIAKAAPNIPLQILAGVTGALQIAKIQSTPLPEYAKGGMWGQVRQWTTRSSLGSTWATGGAINPTAGVPQVGQLHSGGGIKMVDGQTGQMLGEWERGEPYMILSRNTYANNKDVIDSLLHSSLYQGGAPIRKGAGYFEDGGITAPVSTGAAAQSSAAVTDMGSAAMLMLLQSIDSKVGQFPTMLKSYVVLSELNEAQGLQNEIKTDSSFN